MMKKLALTLVFGVLGVGVYGQTIKSLGYNTTNGQVVANTGTNVLQFTNNVSFQGGLLINGSGVFYVSATNGGLNLEEGLITDISNNAVLSWSDSTILSVGRALSFSTNNAATTRANLGLGWSALTNTNASNFRSAIGLGPTNNVTFADITASGVVAGLTYGSAFIAQDTNIYPIYTNTVISVSGFDGLQFHNPIGETNLANILATKTRTNLGLGLSVLTNTNNANFLSDLGIGTNSSPSFSNVSVSNLLVTGNFTNLGTIYGFKTNVGPFEGIGNFFASNNTTVSNETLFRVGLAEQNDKSAQFGFRVARTNNGGEGFAVFSVFGYNALMMIGPSDRSRSNSITNTNAGIEADIWSISPTNKVMTLITTNTGAMQMHRPIGFNTNASAPANTTNVVGWIEMYVGTNSVRVPYYQ
jgi:hypothetical protein